MNEFPWRIIWVVMQQDPRLGCWLPVSFHDGFEEAQAAQATESQRVEAWYAFAKNGDDGRDAEKAIRLMKALQAVLP